MSEKLIACIIGLFAVVFILVSVPYTKKAIVKGIIKIGVAVQEEDGLTLLNNSAQHAEPLTYRPSKYDVIGISGNKYHIVMLSKAERTRDEAIDILTGFLKKAGFVKSEKEIRGLLNDSSDCKIQYYYYQFLGENVVLKE